MKTTLYLLLIFANSLSLFSQNIHKFVIGNGPEDFVLDTFSSTQRLIVSCHERRDKVKKKISYFYSVDINFREAAKMIRMNEPDNFYLNLIGIDIEKFNDKIFLYATSHFKDEYMVVKYQVKEDSLFFIRYYSNPFFYKLNDVAVFKGNFIVSNCKYFNGSIAYCDSLGNCKKLLSHIDFPNGVYFENDSTFYYSSTFENSFVKNSIKDLTVTQSQKIAKIKGADNILKCNGKFYITSHPNFIKFMQHKKTAEKKSPIAVFEYDGNTTVLKKIYTNEGELISAVSSAVIYKNNLYLSQIFDDFILQINLADSNPPTINSSKK